jgi:fructokinase
MILVCGEALIDMFARAAPPDAPMPLEAVVGGSPFNVAVGLARLGAPAALFAGISTDAFGERLFAALRREGVETRHVARSARPTTLSVVALGDGGAPTYAFYGVGAADRSLSLADLPAIGPEVEALHFGSYSIAVPPVADALAALAERERRRFVSLDPNVRLNVEPDVAVWRARVGAMLPHAALVKVSAEDLAHLHPGDEPAAVARAWLAQGAAMVVVTRGGEGAAAFRAGDELAVPHVPVAVVDTVGAGDAFQAALLDGLRRAGLLSRDGLAAAARETLRPILARAANAASIACGRKGADLPRAADLDYSPAALR